MIINLYIYIDRFDLLLLFDLNNIFDKSTIPLAKIELNCYRQH